LTGPAKGKAGIDWPESVVSPVEDFELSTDWAELLPDWRLEKTVGDKTYWTRPGKSGGTSATTEGNWFHVFTDNAEPFEPNTNYSKFDVFAMMNHGGDKKAAVKDLSAQGYGEYFDHDGSVKTNPPPKDWAKKGTQAAPTQVDAGPQAPPAKDPTDVSQIDPANRYLSNRHGVIACPLNAARWIVERKPVGFVQYDSFRKDILVAGVPITDEGVIALGWEISASMKGYWAKEHVREALIGLGHKHEFSSLTRWLDSLVWDGIPRVNRFFTDHYGSEDSPYAGECARVFFLSAVARAYQPGCIADVMPVLIGPQGIGKSKGVALLCPDETWFTDEVGNLNADKVGENLQAKWIVEFGELSRMHAATLETVKSFVTRRTDRYREPWSIKSQDFPRTCIFFGTTNADRPLQDTENRRFMPINVKQAILTAIKEAREQLWAEAVCRYKSGEPWHTTDHTLVAEVRSRGVDARAEDAYEDILREKLAGFPHTTLLQAAEMLGLLRFGSMETVNKLTKQIETRIGQALTKLGFVKRRIGTGAKRHSCYEREV
jgi:hypothetical protein